MYHVLLLGFFLCFSLFSSQPILAGDDVAISPEADWIIQYPVPTAKEDFNDSENGVHYLLVDYQSQVGMFSVEHYYHIALRVKDLKAIEENSTLNFDFNPDYEKLSIHKVATIRKGHITQQLAAENIHLLHREKELEYQIINGTKTASIILEDVRAGDIIEYSYSIKGANPAFQQSFYDRQTLQWSVPVQEYKFRLIHPQQKKINIIYHKTNLQPQIFRNKQQLEYRWVNNNLPAIVNEGQLPSDFTLYPWMQFSEANSWQDIVQWGLPLYQAVDQLSPELQTVIQQIENEHQTSEQRLLAVLQFVQQQIRYLGIEIGSGSFVPNPPSLVLQRRFGDCKDKTLLMITLLKALGIEAYPALVNTQLRDGISKWHPSATAFNHVLVYVKFNDNEYWLDPTRWPQKGNLNTIYQPNYSLALVIKADSQSLIPMQSSHLSKKIILDEWKFNQQNGSATYKITTHYHGYFADYFRQNLASTSLQETQKSYINYFAKIYPSIVLDQPFKITDDSEKNILRIEEVYSVPNLWKKNQEQQQKLEANFYPVDLFKYATKPNTIHRKTPYALDHPVYIEQKTLIHLDDDWDLKDVQLQLNNTGFDFKKTAKYDAGILRLDYRYRSKSHSLTPSNMQHYLTDLETMDNELSYGLWKLDSSEINESSIEQVNWTLVILLILASVVFLLLSVWIYRHNPDTPKPSVEGIDPKLAGIRGWLILSAIGILLTPLKIIMGLYTDFLPALSLPTWNALTQTNSEMYHPGWAPILILETLANLGLLLFALAMIILFFQKRRTFPGFYILFLAFYLLVVLIDHTVLLNFEPLADQITAKDNAETIRAVISSLIWIAYFKFSKRVRVTFVKNKP